VFSVRDRLLDQIDQAAKILVNLTHLIGGTFFCIARLPMTTKASTQTTLDDGEEDVVQSATRRQWPNRGAASCIHFHHGPIQRRLPAKSSHQPR